MNRKEAIAVLNMVEALRAEIEQEPYVSKMAVLDIIDEYKTESEG